MESPESLRVRVVYALPDQQVGVSLEVPPGTTVADAVTRSKLLEKFPEAAARPLSCAVFGRAVPLTYELREGDRVEILRPLLIDPKQSRREAAERSRAATRSKR
jgi:putative ubiquitin-RnfH superfamily antitoxin RatB of RatAB toxin-antitoxin module